MRMISNWVILPIVLAAWTGVASAQADQRPSHIPTQQKQDSPFGTQWAKPPGTTGSQIYNDPRTRDPNSSYRGQRGKSCSAPAMFDPASGTCR